MEVINNRHSPFFYPHFSHLQEKNYGGQKKRDKKKRNGLQVLEARKRVGHKMPLARENNYR